MKLNVLTKNLYKTPYLMNSILLLNLNKQIIFKIMDTVMSRSLLKQEEKYKSIDSSNQLSHIRIKKKEFQFLKFKLIR